ncbi:hypothetical protein JRQ81_005370 [Phrynocephalus forsythii]|uniref:Secreted protein n=1 Tax=Phrynocephalus forsythii TaxID=171643 RepID=A0A9Q0Y3Z0_9SAUR|nr:hypothetical protein JRQ81_005370 [Phrynocephalus forsythii]
MLVKRKNSFGMVLLALCVLVPIPSAQVMEEERVAEDLPEGQRMMQATEAPGEHGVQHANNCAWTFHIPLSGRVCSPPTALTHLASQEDLDHLKTFLAGNGEVLNALQEETLREAGNSRFQDIISDALPDVREANEAFYETLEKFLRDLEDHAQADHPPHAEDEKKKLKEQVRIMDHMLRVTGHLAEEVEQVSQNLLGMLDPEKATAFAYGSPLVSS